MLAVNVIQCRYYYYVGTCNATSVILENLWITYKKCLFKCYVVGVPGREIFLVLTRFDPIEYIFL